VNQTAIATAADYAEALIVARRAARFLVSLLLLMLLVQVGLFLAARFKVDFSQIPEGKPQEMGFDAAKCGVALIDFLGLVVPIVLEIDLLLIVAIMLIGRLIGVGGLVAAFLWAAVLAVMLFPWQAFLSTLSLSTEFFRIPGVLYTWTELARDSRGPSNLILWCRFVTWPTISLLVLWRVYSNSRRGMRLALGEIPPEPVATVAAEPHNS
jgi:hypothetical protein